MPLYEVNEPEQVVPASDYQMAKFSGCDLMVEMDHAIPISGHANECRDKSWGTTFMEPRPWAIDLYSFARLLCPDFASKMTPDIEYGL